MHQEKVQRLSQMGDKYEEFQAYQMKRNVCFSSQFFFDFFAFFNHYLNLEVKKNIQVAPKAHHSNIVIAAINKTLEYIRDYEFQAVYDSKLCQQCKINISSFKNQMVGLLTGILDGSTPFQIRHANRTKYLLTRIIQIREDSFMAKCIANVTEPVI